MLATTCTGTANLHVPGLDSTHDVTTELKLRLKLNYNSAMPYNLMSDSTLSKLGWVPDWEILGDGRKCLRHKLTGKLLPLTVRAGVPTFEAYTMPGATLPAVPPRSTRARGIGTSIQSVKRAIKRGFGTKSRLHFAF